MDLSFTAKLYAFLSNSQQSASGGNLYKLCIMSAKSSTMSFSRMYCSI